MQKNGAFTLKFSDILPSGLFCGVLFAICLIPSGGREASKNKTKNGCAPELCGEIEKQINSQDNPTVSSIPPASCRNPIIYLVQLSFFD